MKERLVSDFYKSDGINFASYDNIRKLPNYIDGLKISQRKLLWAGFDKAFNDFHNTEPFCNITATTTAYIHGPQNLIGIVSLMAAQYCTSNNYPLFIGNDSRTDIGGAQSVNFDTFYVNSNISPENDTAETADYVVEVFTCWE